MITDSAQSVEDEQKYDRETGVACRPDSEPYRLLRGDVETSGGHGERGHSGGLENTQEESAGKKAAVVLYRHSAENGNAPQDEGYPHHPAGVITLGKDIEGI
jgi:hypothetical protein